MANKFIISICAALLPALLFTACYEDKGNYTYSEYETIQIELPELIEVMGLSEDIEFSPRIVSSFVGEINDGNDDYEFGCKINYRHYNNKGVASNWYDIDSLRTKDVKFFAKFDQGLYTLWYTVTNKATGIIHSAKSSVSVKSPTSEGWMVLSNNGAERKARLDIIYPNTKGGESVAVDIMGDEVENLTDATQLSFRHSTYQEYCRIDVYSRSGAYFLNWSNLVLRGSANLRNIDFIAPNFEGEPYVFGAIYSVNEARRPTAFVCITTAGNAYALNNNNWGASYEYPLNVDTPAGEPTYKMAPFVASSKMHPGSSSTAILYDDTNKRFVSWSCDAAEQNMLSPISDPTTGRLFSYSTGMDIVDMEGTRFSGGLVYAVLQDASAHRHIYGINVSGSNTILQESVYDNITAADFDTATDYAFHSQFPLMFYSKDNKVYSYNLAGGSSCDMVSVPAGERITKIKFNLYEAVDPALIINQSDEYLSMQFKLIVASTTGEPNGGKLRFYNIDRNGKMSLLKEFEGLGQEIVDVAYRELNNR